MSIHYQIIQIFQSITGDTSKKGLQDYVRQSWSKGQILLSVDEHYYSILQIIHSLHVDDRFQTESFYLPHQLPSTSTLLYNQEFAARLVHDSPDDEHKYTKFSQYNIEPHYHEVDSIIIVTSQHKHRHGYFMIHDTRLGFDAVIKIPLDFGSIICFPNFVAHTFIPSDVGLSTLNITDSYTPPQTNGFSHPSVCDFDKAVVISYPEWQKKLENLAKSH
ncbi:MAG TPA: hypothetical protein VK203_27835 [Nostocaceae cyanobacterium]|nr:hypothetical protein [Nostocaceae cyanobacterium]